MHQRRSKWAKKDKQPLEIVYINASIKSSNLDVKYAEFLRIILQMAHQKPLVAK
jgi:hypothetical protein